MTDTKDRILDTAEKAFADNGFDGTSLRSIIAEAGVNLAAVHYHFGSKVELLRAVLMRRIAPVNVERLAMLDACEQAAGDGPLAVEGVLRAFVAPTLRVAQQPDGERLVRLAGRLYAETDLLPRLIKERMGAVIDRFFNALRRALPELSEEELKWRIYFASGTMAQALRAFGSHGMLPGKTNDIDATLARLVPFLAAGFRSQMQENK